MSLTSLTELPLDRAVSLDETCDRFEAALRSGEQPRIEDYLASLPAGEQGALLRELLQIEIPQRLKEAGCDQLRQEYGSRFPRFEDDVEYAIRSAPRNTASSEKTDSSSATQHGTHARQSSTTAPADLSIALPCSFGAYELHAEIGHGGMGKVYRGTHRALDRAVAIKLMHPERHLSAESIARFDREMRAVAKLHHPNIVMAYDAGDITGLRFLAMEFVTGWDLSSICRCCGTLPIPIACECIRQASLGLQHVFEHGLVHRDIKPSNLMLTEDGAVKLLDLGLARLKDEERQEQLTHESCPMGTLEYIAPEQARNPHDVDIRADLYSLGCTFFRLLCGFPPFGREPRNSVQLLAAHLTERPPLLRQFRPEAPAELEDLVAELLNKRADDRPQTPREVVEAVKRFASESALSAFACALKEMTDERGHLPKQPASAVKIETAAWSASATSPAESSPSPTAPPQVAEPSRSTRRLWMMGVPAALLVAGALWFGLQPAKPARDLLTDFDLDQHHIAGAWQYERGELYSPLDGVGCVRLASTPPGGFQIRWSTRQQQGEARWSIINTGHDPFAITFAPLLRAAGDDAAAGHDPVHRIWIGDWGEFTSTDERQFVLTLKQGRITLQRDEKTVLDLALPRDGRLDPETLGLPPRAMEVPGIYLLTVNSRFQFREVQLNHQ